MRLLLIEDDLVLSRSLQKDLQAAGYIVDTAADGESGEFLGATEQYDAAIIDLAKSPPTR